MRRMPLPWKGSLLLERIDRGWIALELPVCGRPGGMRSQSPEPDPSLVDWAGASAPAEPPILIAPGTRAKNSQCDAVLAQIPAGYESRHQARRTYLITGVPAESAARQQPSRDSQKPTRPRDRRRPASLPQRRTGIGA